MTRAKRRSDEVERAVVAQIVDGTFPPGSRLPLERDLAEALGVGRPTLREAIQRLERDGWVTVRKAVGTVVNDYWREGTLGILAPMVELGPASTRDLLQWLAELRIGLVPQYVEQAVAHDPARVVSVMVRHRDLPDEAEAYATFDLDWQVELAQRVPNPLFNLFVQTYRRAIEALLPLYFALPAHRAHSAAFYEALLQAAMDSDPGRAAALTQQVMAEALQHAARLAEEAT